MEEASTAALVREALAEAKELVRLEVELAKSEVNREIAQAKNAAIGLAVAIVFGAIGLCLFAMALVLLLGGTAIVAVLVASAFLGVGVIGGAMGYAFVPRTPLEHTRQRLETDFHQLKEHLA